MKTFELPVPFPGMPVGQLISTGRDLFTCGTRYTPAYRIAIDGAVSVAGGGFHSAAATPDGKVWFTTEDGFGLVDGSTTSYFNDGVASYWTDSWPLYSRPAMTTAQDGIVWYSRYWTNPPAFCYPSDPVPGQPPPPPQCFQPPPIPSLPNALVRVDPLGRKKRRSGPVA